MARGRDAFRTCVHSVRRALKAGFNPDQPRVPAGSREGGRWTDGGGATRVAGNDGPGDGPPPLPERVLNRHIRQQHVGKSDEELKARIEGSRFNGLFTSVGMDRNGSFNSAESATALINETLKNNAAEIAKVVNGEESEAFLTWEFGRETGREAYLPTPESQAQFRATTNVGVAIIRDQGSSAGYRVVTAYPRNFNPRVGR